jgi:hypothetical protein
MEHSPTPHLCAASDHLSAQHVDVKGYRAFDAQNRPEGWNLWLTLALPLGAAPN